MMDRETDRWLGLIKEIIWIRKAAPTIKRDKRGYKLSRVCESLIAMPSGEQRGYSFS